MQRIRIRYTLEGRVRFVSARDLTSVWERALRRAHLPIAYSEGYTPHAKVSFPDALPVGVASTGEYAELTFAAPINAGADLGRLSATLPDGMDVTTYWVVPDNAPKLAKMLPAALWELELASGTSNRTASSDDRQDFAQLDRVIARLIDADTVEVVRKRPDGDRIINVRPAVVDLAPSRRSIPERATGVDPSGPSAPAQLTILRAVLRNDGPTVRPADLLHALQALAEPGEPELAVPRLTRRVAQGTAVPGGLREALTSQIEPVVCGIEAEAA